LRFQITLLRDHRSSLRPLPTIDSRTLVSRIAVATQFLSNTIFGSCCRVQATCVILTCQLSEEYQVVDAAKLHIQIKPDFANFLSRTLRLKLAKVRI
jgi:hypothetical protein